MAPISTMQICPLNSNSVNPKEFYLVFGFPFVDWDIDQPKTLVEMRMSSLHKNSFHDVLSPFASRRNAMANFTHALITSRTGPMQREAAEWHKTSCMTLKVRHVSVCWLMKTLHWPIHLRSTCDGSWWTCNWRFWRGRQAFLTASDKQISAMHNWPASRFVSHLLLDNMLRTDLYRSIWFCKTLYSSVLISFNFIAHCVIISNINISSNEPNWRLKLEAQGMQEARHFLWHKSGWIHALRTSCRTQLHGCKVICWCVKLRWVKGKIFWQFRLEVCSCLNQLLPWYSWKHLYSWKISVCLVSLSLSCVFFATMRQNMKWWGMSQRA